MTLRDKSWLAPREGGLPTGRVRYVDLEDAEAVEAERDRYRAALERIAGAVDIVERGQRAKYSDLTVLDAGRYAQRVLDGGNA